MQIHRIVLSILLGFICTNMSAQGSLTMAEADAESYRLYREQKWSELLVYGKTAIAAKVEFPLLHMRTGFAAFTLGNYRESLKQYQIVLEQDAENLTALIYCYWNSFYLNERGLARFYAGKMSPALRTSKNINYPVLSGVNLEYAYKSPDIATRGDAQYVKLGFDTELGSRLHWENAFAWFDQTIQEPLFTDVTDNMNIRINQKEFFTKLRYTASGKIQLIAGFHYLQTPFNNFSYRNVIGFAGLKYLAPYLHMQGLFQSGRIRDEAYTQFNASFTLYPKGNNNLYFITDGAIAKDPALTQTIGFRMLKNIWVEGRTTLGQYGTLLTNDGLYVYNDIDLKKFRVGGSLYYVASRILTLQMHYAYDRKELYQRTGNFYNQHSITGGIQWSF